MMLGPASRGSNRNCETTLALKRLKNSKLKRINIGCGQTPTRGWLNYDNSLSVLLARRPFLSFFLERTGLLKPENESFISAVQKRGILWADATKRIPLPDSSAQVIYTSHMIEHLGLIGARTFLREAYRVLAVGGVIRIAVPDLKRLIEQYIVHGDANSFMEQTLLGREKQNSLINRLKYLLAGDRRHLWMYDGPSLCRLLVASGFRNPSILEPGMTIISDPGELNLYEREFDSVYVEALK